jgi:hypothetical protein
MEISIICGPHSAAEFCVVALFASQAISKKLGAHYDEK